LLAVAVELQVRVAKEKRELEIYYLGPASAEYLQKFEANGIIVRPTIKSRPNGSLSLSNFWEWLKFGLAFGQSLWSLFWIMPDLVFSKGGPGALAVVLAAAFYRVPIAIHESDSIPGTTNLWSSRFSRMVFLGFVEAAEYFPRVKDKLGVGNPIRRFLLADVPIRADAKKFLGFRSDEPLVLVWGGSQGATRINSGVAAGLGELLEFTQVLHQVGPSNYSAYEREANPVLAAVPEWNREKYVFVDYLNDEIKEALAGCDLVVSRSGSSIFEIAAFGRPSLLIPYPESASGHQEKNAKIYAGSGAAEILSDADLAAGRLVPRIKELLADPEKLKEMGEKARQFAKPEAALIIAQKILELADG